MEKSRKAGLGIMALVALALVAAYMVGATTLGGAFASSPTQTATASNPQQTAPTGDSGKQAAAAKEEKLLNSFMTNFSSRLGVTEAKLNSSFIDAVNATVDQAVHDGTITQAEADNAKAMVQKGGFRGIIEQGFSSGDNKAPGNPGDEYANPKAALIETMGKIGVSPDDMQRGAEAGKSLVDLASEHNVDAATLKTKILETFKAQLDTAVHGGKLTQAQADVELQKFAQQVDRIINSKGGKVGFGVNNDGYQTNIDSVTEAAERAAWNAAPPILGMQAVEMKEAMGGNGKTLADLAREHNVAPQTLHDAMLHAGKAEFDKAVTAKTLTQAQADSDYQALTAWVDNLMSMGVK